MSILKEPTLDEIKRYNKDELGVTLLDGEIVRIPAICDYIFKNWNKRKRRRKSK